MQQKSVRIHHPSLRNCVYTLEQPSRPYPSPYPCPLCHVTHYFKTFHLNLNANGDVCVAPEIYELFKREGLTEELKATKAVVPRPTVIDMNGPSIAPAVVSRESGLVIVNGKGVRD